MLVRHVTGEELPYGITPEMVRAGTVFLRAFTTDFVPEDWWAERLYILMEAARRGDAVYLNKVGGSVGPA